MAHKKQIKHDDFSDILHALLKYHVKKPKISFGEMINKIYGINSPDELTDSQVLSIVEHL
jgi:hypothetical protein